MYWSSYATIFVPSSPRGRTGTVLRLPISRSLRRKAWSSTTHTCSRQYAARAVRTPFSISEKQGTDASCCLQANLTSGVYQSWMVQATLSSQASAPTQPTSGLSKRTSEPAVWTPQARQARSGSPFQKCSSYMGGTSWAWARYITLQSRAHSLFRVVVSYATVAFTTSFYVACPSDLSSRQPTRQ